MFGKKYTQDKLGKIKGTFDEEKTMYFDRIGKEILGKNKVLIDNFWFIDPFYHDGSNCSLREGVKIIDFPYLTDINLPELCPFSRYGCGKK